MKYKRPHEFFKILVAEMKCNSIDTYWFHIDMQ